MFCIQGGAASGASSTRWLSGFKLSLRAQEPAAADKWEGQVPASAPNPQSPGDIQPPPGMLRNYRPSGSAGGSGSSQARKASAR
jgi:hypothetical protein